MKWPMYCSLLSTMISLIFSSSDACTGIKLTAKDGSVVHGRTCEFGINLDISTAVIPRGYSFTGTTPNGTGLTYQTKYGFVGSITFNHPAVMDGMNEKGLSVGTFYFPGFANYTSVTNENQGRALSPIEFPNWILSQFATTDEVKAGLANIVIVPTVIPGWGNTPPPFHYIVYDKSGSSIVIEPINGKLVVTDNPLGVFTNSPTFDWHMTNLRNYINLRATNVGPLKVEGIVLAPFGQGSGMVGLPGDFTPPGRFIRAAIYSITALPPANSQEGVLQAFHILNQFDIPAGVVREEGDGILHTDITLATVVHDPNALKYYFKTYSDQTLRLVNLNAFDLNAKEIKSASDTGRQPYVDMSNELKILPKS